jgi:two-component sensor histidine kinase
VLLREVHHRVKNNLQVIASLLTLKSEHLHSAETVGVLEEMRARVHSLTGIHELLYEAKDLSSIDFGEYLTRLAQDLDSLYAAEFRPIRITVEANATGVDIGQAVPCALIVNELVMNAVKHAFPNTEPGRIEIRMRREEAGYVLEVADNGIGLPADIDPSNSSTMGLQLVSLLTEQLHGSLAVRRDQGTRFEIRFQARSSTPNVA